jgi:hypothetical protein
MEYELMIFMRMRARIYLFQKEAQYSNEGREFDSGRFVPRSFMALFYTPQRDEPTPHEEHINSSRNIYLKLTLTILSL